jgi:hypothetical protein
MVTVTIENAGNVGAEVPFIVKCAGSEVSRRLEVRAKSTATTRIELAESPVEVVVNDSSVPEQDFGNNVFEIQAEDKK